MRIATAFDATPRAWIHLSTKYQVPLGREQRGNYKATVVLVISIEPMQGHVETRRDNPPSNHHHLRKFSNRFCSSE